MAENHKDDNKRLLELQERFLSGDSRAWTELWLLSSEVCGRIIRHEREKKGFFISQDDFKDKTTNAVSYVLCRYRKTYKSGKSYKIEKNFISALYFGVRHALYYRSEKDKAFDNILFIDNYDRLSQSAPENWAEQD